MEDAEIMLCQLVQNVSYSDEINSIKIFQPSLKSSPICPLDPYLMGNGLLRACGRIYEAIYLPVEARSPIIMIQKHCVSEIILQHHHQSMTSNNSFVYQK